MKERKLLLTHYKQKNAAFLLQSDRLIQVMLDSDSPYRIGDIYVGRVKNIVPAMKAAFVELAPGNVGFLSVPEGKPFRILNRPDASILQCGDELLVQVSKEALKTKEVTLTTDISFSGNYFVFMPYDRGIHYSQKLSAVEKAALQNTVSQIVTQQCGDMDAFIQNYGCIVRTNAAQADAESLAAEFRELFCKIEQLIAVADKRTVYSCLSKEASFWETILKNHYQPDKTELITDVQEIYDNILQAEHAFADIKNSIRLYDDTRISMYTLYGMEEKLKEATQKKVWLKSGGYLVIEPTEALTVIDVNSGKACYAKGKAAQIQFHSKINEEAAVEILRQLRLRNLSGIIIVDFLKTNSECSDALLQQLKSLARFDPVKTTIIGTTALGLVEITRKKTEAPLYEKIGNYM